MNELKTYSNRLSNMGHRNYVGGTDSETWYSIGRLQYHFLVSEGLEPECEFLDIACGSLRLGQYLIPYLKTGNYYGLEGNPELVEKGLENELLFDLSATKSPNFAHNYEFDLSFCPYFDYAMAQSLFTHLRYDDIQSCFKSVSKKMGNKSMFYFTYFEGDGDNNPSLESDPHLAWYYDFKDIKSYANNEGLELTRIGNWGHPRNQMMAVATKG